MNAPPPMRLVFAGTPEFAAVHLEALLEHSRHRPVAVYTQPDRPAGRGKKLAVSPVKRVAQEHGLPVLQPASLRDPQACRELAELAPDLMVVVAYGLILPQAVLDIPRLGCINVHASLLPRWRGAAPIQRAVAAGDTESGVSIMQMEAGLDTGPVLLERRCVLSADETGGSLHDKLAVLGAEALLEALDLLATSRLTPQEQPAEGVTYAHKIDKSETRVDWSRPAPAVARLIRALTPFPAAWSDLDGVRVKLFDPHPVSGRGEPGLILAAGRDGVRVACGEGAIMIGRLQLPGGRPLAVAEVLKARARQFAPGRRFGHL